MGAPRIRLLGPVDIETAHGEGDLGSPKQVAVFALMALDVGRVVPVARFVDELWGDSEPQTATSTLQVYMSRLRRALRDAFPDSEAASRPAPRVVRRSPGYLLEADLEDVDVTVLAQRVSAARAAGADPDRALALLEEGLSLVQGPCMVDVVDRLGLYGSSEARRIDSMVVDAAELKAELHLDRGEVTQALSEAEIIAGEHPRRESVQGLLMRAYYRAGRPAEALETFEALRRRLADELGADPGPELRRLHTALLRHDPSLGPAPSRGATSGSALEVTDPVPGPRGHAPGGPGSDGETLPPPAVRREAEALVVRLLSIAGGACTTSVLAEAADLAPEEYDDALDRLRESGTIEERSARGGVASEVRLRGRADPSGGSAHASGSAAELTDAHGRLGAALSTSDEPGPPLRVARHLTLAVGGPSSPPLSRLWAAVLDASTELRPEESGELEALLVEAVERVAALGGGSDGDPHGAAWLQAFRALQAELVAARKGWFDPEATAIADGIQARVHDPLAEPVVLTAAFSRVFGLLIAGECRPALDRAQRFLTNEVRTDPRLAGFHAVGRVLRGIAYWGLGREPEACTDLRWALSLADTLPGAVCLGYASPTFAARGILGLALDAAGFATEARELTAENVAIAADASANDACALRIASALYYAQVGDVVATRVEAERSTVEAERLGHPGLFALGSHLVQWSSLVDYARTGDDRLRLQQLERQRQEHALLEEAGVHIMLPAYDCLMAEAEFVSGYPRRAVDAAQRGLGRGDAHGHVLWGARLRDVLTRALRAADPSG